MHIANGLHLITINHYLCKQVVLNNLSQKLVVLIECHEAEAAALEVCRAWVLVVGREDGTAAHSILCIHPLELFCACPQNEGMGISPPPRISLL